MITGSTVMQHIGIIFFGNLVLWERETDVSSPFAVFGASGTSSLISKHITGWIPGVCVSSLTLCFSSLFIVALQTTVSSFGREGV